MIRLAHPHKLFLFIALSLADLTLTWFLLERARGHAYEANPVASWCLAHFGWAGLAGFKLGVVLLVAALVQVVSRRRPASAGRTLGFGCFTLLAVVLYSACLVRGALAEAADLEQRERAIQQAGQKLDRVQASWSLLYRLSNDLVAGHRTLPDAVAVLGEAEHLRDQAWLAGREQRFPGRSLQECQAIQLIRYALLAPQDDSSGAERLAQELDAQFQSCFGRPAPASLLGAREMASRSLPQL
jgi:hypothetical protein